MLDPVGSLDNSDISPIRPIAGSCRCATESFPDLGGFVMLEGRGGADELRCDVAVALLLSTVSDDTEGLPLSEVELED